MKPIVYVVHCIDTEGPLHEPLSVTFERLKHTFHIDLEPSRETLRLLREGRIDLGGKEAEVLAMVSDTQLAYNNSWEKIDAMLAEALSEGFRNTLPDSRGNGWIYNWFCMDHVDYEVNPRRRDMGFHNIFDHYAAELKEYGAERDGLHFHYHPHDFFKRAHRCATHWWASSGSLYQILCRRIIDRQWFPCCNRPGFQVNRPDSHWFLEQFIPFDYSSLATAEMETSTQFDFSNGRSGDWRRAPRNWQPYHPSHDDYQIPGDCRRWIARCLNIGSRCYNLNPDDVRQAFTEAREGKPVVLSFADHDFRDIRPDVNAVRDMLAVASKEYPDVEFVYSEAAEAMRAAVGIPDSASPEVGMRIDSVDGEAAHVLTVEVSEPIFGPQPFLALKTVAGSYHHDNFDFQAPFQKWTYTFDDETMSLGAVEKIGIGMNSRSGQAIVAVLDA